MPTPTLAAEGTPGNKLGPGYRRIEELTSGMSRKIWQTITIGDRSSSRGGVAG